MSDVEGLATRIVQLEELFSHQERSLQQLSEAVSQMRTEIDAAAAKSQESIARLEAEIENQATPHDPNERPPHY